MKKIIIKKKNFLIKILIKILRKVGYEIIDQSSLVITNDAEIKNSIRNKTRSLITLPLGQVKINDPIKKILIIHRMFTNENTLLSQNKKRVFEEKKYEYSFRSLYSILKSCSFAAKKREELEFEIVVIDDNSSSRIKEHVIEIFNRFNDLKTSLVNLEISEFESKMNFSNNKRMVAHNAHIFKSKQIALEKSSDVIYFVEDDYIHTNDCIDEMINAYDKFKSITSNDIVLVPSDYPYLYYNTENFGLTIGHKYHWRIIDQSLCTYMTTKSFVKKHWSHYEDMMTNVHDPYEKPLHNIYSQELCLSPLPTLAIHMTNINSIYGISPTVDIKKIWEQANYD